jgi:N-acetylmuramoyl-L-alanine amidase
LTVVGTESSLRVRTGPGTSYEHVSNLFDGSYVSVLERRNGWYRILGASYGEFVTGWVSGDYLGRP